MRAPSKIPEDILSNPNMRIAAYTVFYDTKRMSELGRGSPTSSLNPPECGLKATIAFLLLLHRLWTLQNGLLGVSSGLLGLAQSTSGGFWAPLEALLVPLVTLRELLGIQKGSNNVQEKL